MKTCQKCQFWSPVPGSDVGSCHRYPLASVSTADHWCGEYVKRPAPADRNKSAELDNVASTIHARWNGKCEEKGQPPAPPVRGPVRDMLREAWGRTWFRENWMDAMDALFDSPWHLGANKGGWRADLSWFLKPGNAEKMAQRLKPSYEGEDLPL